MDEQNQTPQSEPAPAALPAATSNEERTWALFGHLAALSAFITGVGCILGPLVVWLIKKDTMPFAAHQAKEALNFNITVAIVALALIVFSIMTFGIGLIIAWPLAVALFIAWLVLTILAAIKANEGVAYRYPLSLRLVS